MFAFVLALSAGAPPQTYEVVNVVPTTYTVVNRVPPRSVPVLPIVTYPAPLVSEPSSSFPKSEVCVGGQCSTPVIGVGFSGSRPLPQRSALFPRLRR
jgi:hypothetical protein